VFDMRHGTLSAPSNCYEYAPFDLVVGRPVAHASYSPVPVLIANSSDTNPVWKPIADVESDMEIQRYRSWWQCDEWEFLLPHCHALGQDATEFTQFRGVPQLGPYLKIES
jgi:hypothetical protein